MKLNNFLISAFVLGCGAMVTTSCTDWLKEDPQSFIGPENIDDSESGVDTWVTGVYSNWLYDMFCWSEFPRVLELDADYISGPSWLFGHLGAGDFQGESSLAKMWTGPYNLINDANKAIRYIGAMSSVDTDYKNNAIGEMEFQKAFCYFMLVRAYGAVPYFDTDVDNGNTYYEPRRPVSEIYGHIIDLLTDASAKMYKNDNANYKAGHVSAGSAAGLLAKVYATMASAAMPAGTKITVKTGKPYHEVWNIQQQKNINVCNEPASVVLQKDTVSGYTQMDSQDLYKKAASWAKKVIDGEMGSYQLSDYSVLWKASNRNASEFMWAIQSVDGDQTYCMHVHSYYSGYKSDASSQFLYSGGWVGCTYNWYALFDDNDYRITKGVRHTWRYYYQDSYNGCFYYPQKWCTKVTGYDLEGNAVENGQEAEYKNTGYAYQYNTSSECLAFTTKYDDCTNDASDYTDSQWPFLRYADVLLVYAEAENELGNTTEAIKYLNIVRARSNATLMSTDPGQTALRSAILEERAKEFACEGDRRWDLIRWGIYLQAMNAIGGYDDASTYKTRTARNLLYPIPTEEMNVNKAITENNPGWN